MRAYRDLRRIWAVFSVCWCVLVVTGALAVGDGRRGNPAGVRAEAPTAGEGPPSILSTMSLAAAFPAALLVLGLLYVRLGGPRRAAVPLLPGGRRWRTLTKPLPRLSRR